MFLPLSNQRHLPHKGVKEARSQALRRLYLAQVLRHCSVFGYKVYHRGGQVSVPSSSFASICLTLLSAQIWVIDMLT